MFQGLKMYINSLYGYFLLKMGIFQPAMLVYQRVDSILTSGRFGNSCSAAPKCHETEVQQSRLC